MNRFIEQIALAKTDGTFIKWLDRIKKVKHIVLDDFDLQPFTHAVKLILLQILEDRYDKASTIIALNYLLENGTNILMNLQLQKLSSIK